MIQANNTLAIEELTKALEPVIRRIIREELKAAPHRETDMHHLTPDSPLYEDMSDIKKRKDKDRLEFYSLKRSGVTPLALGPHEKAYAMK